MLLLLTAFGVCPPKVRAQEPADASAASSLDGAQQLYYVGRYQDSAAAALAWRDAHPDDLASYELRSSALLFQVKRHIGEVKDKGAAFRRCAECPALLAAFGQEVAAGRKIAHARLDAAPDDIQARFMLGKLNLNHVWMYLGTLGRRTGWSEYWEARKSLDAVLKVEPQHVRARVARAWIDYIVDTRVPWSVRWMLGGGDKARALRVAREAAAAEAPPYVRAEAQFALWEMLVREKQMQEAVAVARLLARDFPENAELARFLSVNG